MKQPHIVKSICNLCVARCGIDVHTENGRVKEVTGMQESPFNMLCMKALAIPEMVHSEERLTTPLKKVNSRFIPVSWDEALDRIADQLIKLRKSHGAKSLLTHLGVPFIYSQTEYMARRFCDLYGTPNYTSGASFCFLARVIGHCLTCGTHISAHYTGAPECMMVWGQNPTESRLIQADHIHALLGRGSKLIVVDPRATELAKKADIHAQIRPGTDCALALGMLNVIIEQQLFDRSFVDHWTLGFDELAAHVKNYPPEMVEKITWVKAETIRRMAVMYATTTPATLSPGISLDHSTNGIQAIRAITILVAITGNLDVNGGNTYGPGFRMTDLRVPNTDIDGPPVGQSYPIFTRFTQEQSVVPAIEQMITQTPYPIKAMLIAGSNPALTWPNSNKFRQCRKNLGLMVVMDIFMTETAKMADFVLPGTTFLETQNIRTYPSDMTKGGLPLVAKSNQAVEPVGDAMEDWKIWAELGRRTGYPDFFPWQNTTGLLTDLLKDTKISLSDLEKNPGGIYYTERAFKKYIHDGFNTPSGKVELYSKILEENGYAPLPTFHEPEESPVNFKDKISGYPLMFISGPRTIVYTHSQYRNINTLRSRIPEPFISIHPDAAQNHGITAGDSILVESVRGKLTAKAEITKDVHPKTVVMQHGWTSANANLLTDDEAQDPVSGYPGIRLVMCRVCKAS